MASSSTSENIDQGLQHSVYENGCYVNPWPTWNFPSKRAVLKWMLFTPNNFGKPSKQELDNKLPILPILKEVLEGPPLSGVRVTWIGHATLLLQMEGLNILTDPVFSSHASFVQFGPSKRFRDTPCTIQDLPPIHAVVISHNHYDHLDYDTVQKLNVRFGEDTRWFVPKGVKEWMESTGCKNVVELDWWDENCIPNHPDVKFAFTPTQHWSKRTLLDDNKTLWGSWCILGSKNRVYFAGDTGYCSVFKQIGRKYGPFDLAAIPIGAYEPRWMMKSQHVDPPEAVQIHIDVRAKKSVAIHWGTFALANEAYLEPRKMLKDSLAERTIPEDDFFAMKHGESRLLEES